MKRFSNGRNFWLALALLGLVAAPAAAQQSAGDRYVILVPYLGDAAISRVV